MRQVGGRRQGEASPSPARPGLAARGVAACLMPFEIAVGLDARQSVRDVSSRRRWTGRGLMLSLG